MEKKTKEIGIKKILGASVAIITRKLCGTFMLPVSLSAFSICVDTNQRLFDHVVA